MTRGSSDRQIFLTHAPGAGKGGRAGALADTAAGYAPILIHAALALGGVVAAALGFVIASGL